MLLLDNSGRFVTGEGKRLSVTATQNARGRWTFRDDSGRTIASGMTPAEFARRFWFRDDFQARPMTREAKA